MSRMNPNELPPEVLAEYAADLRRMDCQNAGELLDHDDALDYLPADRLRSLHSRLTRYLIDNYGPDPDAEHDEAGSRAARVAAFMELHDRTMEGLRNA